MTTWQARRAKSGDTTRILCGYLTAGRPDCRAILGRVETGTWTESEWTMPAVAPDRRVLMRPGMTEAGTLDEWRMSRRARETERGPSEHVADLPCYARCSAGHRNRIDATILRV